MDYADEDLLFGGLKPKGLIDAMDKSQGTYSLNMLLEIKSQGTYSWIMPMRTYCLED